MEADTQGNRIRSLLASSEGAVTIIAPFIKVAALRFLIDVIPSNSHIHCVSRWRPKEIAAGVSDPEILDLLEARGNSSLSLVDRLHAKMYIAGNRCLAGSANVTFAGLGEGSDDSNVEVLVETNIDDTSIASTLEEIRRVERPATQSMAEDMRFLADNLANSVIPAGSVTGHWFPGSRIPERAYQTYIQPRSKYTKTADKVLLGDLASANLQPGLGESEFRAAIRSLLSAIPIGKTLLEASEDTTLTRADASPTLERLSGGDFSANDLWIAFVSWMAHFFDDRVMKQDITEIALRRARLLS